MPVAEQVRVNTHTGNGSTTNFAYGYRIFEDADLTVTVDGVVQTLTTDYTVNGADDAGGGTIDFITAPINLSVVTISGELPYDRDTDYIQNGSMIARTFDDDHDKAIMLIQQLVRDVKRSIKVPIEETTDQEVSTTAANRADKILAFDGAGLPVASSITDLSSILTTVDTSLALSSGVLSVVIPNRQAVAGGTVDAITATFVPTVAALANNIEVIVEASGANATTTPTFTPDGLTPKTMVRDNDIALQVNDIPGANYRMHLVFDATLDKWVLLNPAQVGVSSLITTPTLTIPTLTTPKILTTGYIADGGGDEYIEFVESTTPVNHLRVTNADTGAFPELAAVGDDTNIDLKLTPKGTGGVQVNGPMAPVTWPSVSAHKGGSDQTGLSGTTKITFGTEEFDTNGDFASSTFTPTVAGKYLIAATVQFVSSVDTELLQIFLYKNAAAYKQKQISVGAAGNQSISIEVVVDANGSTDNFEIYASTGNDNDIEGDTKTTFFTASRIG